MKKKITYKDGTIEELEGTAEELAELERGRKDEGSKKKKDKEILRGSSFDELKKIFRELDEARQKELPFNSICLRPHADVWPYIPPYRLWVYPTWPNQPYIGDIPPLQPFYAGGVVPLTVGDGVAPLTYGEGRVFQNGEGFDTTQLKISGHIPMFGDVSPGSKITYSANVVN